MTWVAVAVAGAGVLGAGASYAGSKKQAKGAEKGANLQLEQFRILNQQQQPYIQSGYGALGKLNTLLGIGGRMPSGGAPVGGSMQNHAWRPMPNGGIKQGLMVGPQAVQGGNSRLKQLLALRAANGDTEAARMMGQV